MDHKSSLRPRSFDKCEFIEAYLAVPRKPVESRGYITSSHPTCHDWEERGRGGGYGANFTTAEKVPPGEAKVDEESGVALDTGEAHGIVGGLDIAVDVAKVVHRFQGLHHLNAQF